MKSEDVVLPAEGEEVSGIRYSAHYFRLSSSTQRSFPTGSQVRVPSNMADWPPDILFDYVYASAVIKHFGIIEEGRLLKWRDTYYPEGALTSQGVSERVRKENITQGERDRQRQIRERQERGKTRSDKNLPRVDLLELFWEASYGPKANFEFCLQQAEERERAEAEREREESRSKVVSWIEQVF